MGQFSGYLYHFHIRPRLDATVNRSLITADASTGNLSSVNTSFWPVNFLLERSAFFDEFSGIEAEYCDPVLYDYPVVVRRELSSIPRPFICSQL
jgi:hypothetical protein